VNALPNDGTPTIAASFLQRARDESGQALAMTVVALVALLGICAFVIDVGTAYLAQRQLQSSADAAALAGVQEIPNVGTAVAVARQYDGRAGSKNNVDRITGPVQSSAVTKCLASGVACTPANAVAVVQTAQVQTSFARVLGIDTIDVTARATAQITSNGAPWAIFAYDQSCGGLVLKSNGDNVNINGGIRSNGSFEVNGKNIHATYASSGGPNGCQPKVDGENIDFGGQPEPVFDTKLHPWPLWFTKEEFSCTFSKAKFTFNTPGMTIPSGTYCASEVFEVNGDHIKGTITVLAPEIKLNGTGQTFRPYEKDMLFFATGTKELVLNGQDYDWEGMIFHPGGRVKINGDSASIIRGMIQGLQVEINGAAFNMEGTGPDASARVISLVE
jgi:Flp pilus assembly protein TadG